MKRTASILFAVLFSLSFVAGSSFPPANLGGMASLAYKYASTDSGVDPRLVLSIMTVTRQAKVPLFKGRGLMNINDYYGRTLKLSTVELENPEINVRAGVECLRRLYIFVRKVNPTPVSATVHDAKVLAAFARTPQTLVSADDPRNIAFVSAVLDEYARLKARPDMACENGVCRNPFPQTEASDSSAVAPRSAGPVAAVKAPVYNMSPYTDKAQPQNVDNLFDGSASREELTSCAGGVCKLNSKDVGKRMVPKPMSDEAIARRVSPPKVANRYDNYIVRYSQEFNMDPNLIKAWVATESQFDPNAKSSVGATGLLQFMPKDAQWFVTHVMKEPFKRSMLGKPEYNLRFGVAYIAYLFEQARHKLLADAPLNPMEFPNWVIERVIGSYNGGASVLLRPTEKMSSTIRNYIASVMSIYNSGEMPVTDNKH